MKRTEPVPYQTPSAKASMGKTVESTKGSVKPRSVREPYDKRIAYGQSKTANVLFAVEADRALLARPAGASISWAKTRATTRPDSRSNFVDESGIIWRIDGSERLSATTFSLMDSRPHGQFHVSLVGLVPATVASSSP